MELREQRRRLEEAFDGETYMSGLGADEVVHWQFVASAISYYQTVNDNLQEIIALKNRVNVNAVKLKLLKSLLDLKDEDIQASATFGQLVDASSALPFMKKVTQKGSLKGPMEITTGSSKDQNEFSASELEAMVEAAQSEKSRLTNAFMTLQSRNKTLSSELSKTADIVRIKTSERLDEKIAEQRREIDDINQEIEMLTAS